MRYRATLAYDGTAYQGFQRQRDGIPTIQACVEQAISVVTKKPSTVVAAGRTDAGVHAVGQVIAFDVEWKHDVETLLQAINANLPIDIALQDIRQAPGFHPRFDAISRCYRYTVAETTMRQPLLAHRAWQIDRKLDVGLMQTAANLLIGEHDFAAFGKPPQGDNTVREVLHSNWQVKEVAFGRLLEYVIEANAFLQHMVRRIVGMLVRVGDGMISLATFKAAFESADLAQSPHLAPPQGLVLQQVRYMSDA